MRKQIRLIITGVVCLGAVLAGCGGDDDADSGSTTAKPTTTVAVAPLRILVTDDDGVGAAGINALVEGLTTRPDTEVIVVAPATDQSGTGGKVTAGALDVQDTTTAGGYPAKAVAGYPADTIVWAIDQHGVEPPPDLVISGINAGQNLGPVVNASGTIGAARAAAARGFPALAVSQGVGTTLDYSTAVQLTLDWVDQWQKDGSKTDVFESINVPTCGTGEVRELQEVPAATSADDRPILASNVDCATPIPPPVDDVDAFNGGYATISPIPVTAG